MWVSLERPAQGTSRCARAPPSTSQTPRPAQPRALQCNCGRPLEARQPPADPCPPPTFPTGGVGERCSPQGPVSSEVTKAQRAHRKLRSLECSWGKEVLSTPQDLPSTVCRATCDPLGHSRSAIGHMPHARLWGSVVGWRKPQVTRPTDSPGGLSATLPCPTAGARSSGHTHPPPHVDRRTAAQWQQKLPNYALTQSPKPPTWHYRGEVNPTTGILLAAHYPCTQGADYRPEHGDADWLEPAVVCRSSTTASRSSLRLGSCCTIPEHPTSR